MLECAVERLARGDREADVSFHTISAVVEKFKMDKTQAEEIYTFLRHADWALRSPEARSVSSEEYKIRQGVARLDVIDKMKARLPSGGVDLLLQELGFEFYWLKGS